MKEFVFVASGDVSGAGADWLSVERTQTTSKVAKKVFY